MVNDAQGGAQGRREGFTPGPWRACRWWESAGMTIEDADAIGDRQDWEAADYTRIEDAAGRSVVACHDLSTIRPADARLIAAAPELLALVNALQDWYDDNDGRSGPHAGALYDDNGQTWNDRVLYVLRRVQGEG